ncbi:MAG: SDR family NAD(P)-dependent oxidoreductase [Anaerolineae bacterium]|nr:SDR family NAD(P)-dependent oxidoreductase [Anaerolineae bacterium]
MSESYLPDEQLSPTKRALLELKSLRARLNTLERARTEPIAIVGAGCRFPGGANDPDTFWQNLKNGVHAITDIPPDRWDVDAYYDPDPHAPGKMYTRRGGFLPDVDQFDAPFFGITPREAKGLDPQQRLLLEVSWEALERSGIKPDGLEGSQTGVYFGVMLYDYGQRYLHQQDGTAVDAYYASGTDTSFAAGRVSYILGLQGPSLTLNTVCSSSLVAVHLACQSLRAGETDLALAGGVNVITSPEMHISLSRMGALSPDGVSKTFDAAANGYVRSEGCGIVVLKRLSDALADGDPILALIRGTAVNHDGPSGGLTVPNGPAQQALIRRALQNAGVASHQISYVEAHGTGTPLGDPIEVKALDAVLNEGRSPNKPLLIGSVKTNIGHLESAAGVAGLMKVALALHHQAIPPHLHLQHVNQAIGLEEMPVTIPTALTPWPVGEKPRLAGVSSFGLSGINAHVILEEAPQPVVTETQATRPYHLLTLSAKSEAALQAQATQFAQYLAAHPDVPLADVCHTLHQARAHFNHRLSLAAASPAEAAAKLRELNEGKVGEGVFRGQADGERGAIAFLFPGQGGQYVGMAQELYETHTGFRQTVDECTELVRPYLARPLLSVIYPQPGEPSPLDEMVYAQPAMFTIEYALAKLWQSWGVQPDLLLGHSLGEYAAACLAGVLSLADGLKLVAERGRLMQYETEPGWMVVVFADEEQVQEALAPYSQEVGIAAVNGPRNVTISGRATAVHAVMTTLAAQGIQTRRLNIPHASHSPLMEPILGAYAQIVAGTSLARPSLPVVSNGNGQIAGAEMAQPDYWVAHMRQPVRFADGIHCLQQQGATIYIEMGPKPTLLGMGQRIAGEGAWLPSLHPKRGDWQQMLESVGALITLGVEVDRASLDQGYGRRRMVLPTYPFQRQRYWLPVKPGVRATHKAQPEPPEPDWLYELRWQEQPPADEPTEPMGHDRWLIFADQGGVGQALAGRLAAAGDTATLVWAGETWACTAVDQYHLDPTRPDHYARLLQECDEVRDWQGIIHLWSLDTETALTLDQLHQAQVRGCGSVLHLVQAMAQCQGDGRGRLWLVTRGVQSTGKEAARIQMEQSPLWGFGRVIALEQPDLWGGLIDLPPLSDTTNDLAEQIGQLLAQIRCPDAENQVAFRENSRFVPRLARSAPDHNHKPVTIQADGTYLVTGGLGNLGLAVARWLAGQGAGRLILTSRTGVSAADDARTQQMETIQTLEAQGVQVQVARADVADWSQMAALFAELENGPPLRGIIHAAGVVTAHTITEMPTAALYAALQAKVTGTWVLHQLCQTTNAPLDFFVLFSSGASVWGSQGMAHYAAANHFLDAMAHYRRALGLPALSVNWGWWDGHGMVSADLAQFFAQIGLAGMAAPAALDTLRYLLETDAVQQTVAAIEWSRFKPIYEIRGKQPLLEQIAIALPAQNGTVDKAANGLVAQIKAAASGDQWELLLGHVRQQVTAVIGADSSESLDTEQGFFAMGMDSIMTVELRNRLEASLTCSLPPTVAFEYPTIHDLAAFLARDILRISANGNGKVDRLPPAEMEATTGANEHASSSWDGLSEEELLSLVDSELLTISELV